MNKYTQGRNFEYRVKKAFLDNGFQVVRAASSKGPADLVAFRMGELLLIQCKIGDWHQVAEWNDLIDIAESTGSTPVFAQKKGRKMLLWRMSTKKDQSRKTVLDSPYVLDSQLPEEAQ